MRAQAPNWQPISALPLIASMIDGMLEDSQEQHQTLLEARPRPHTLDDYAVNRVFKVFTEQAENLTIYEAQLSRWKGLHLTPDQRAEVDRLAGQLMRAQTVNTNILALAKELKEGTIDRVLEKSDFEVGLESLRKSKI